MTSRLSQPSIPAPAPMPSEAAHPTFWQHPFVQNVLPLGSSLALHAGLIILGLLTYQAVRIITVTAKPQPQPAITDFDKTPLGDIEALKAQFRGPGNNPNKEVFQDRDPSATERGGWNTFRGKDLDSLRAGLRGGSGGDDAAMVGLIGLGPSNLLGRGRNGVGGDGSGADGDGGVQAPFGRPDPTAGDPSVARTIFQPRRGARRIVYVCDASGSMMSKFDTLRMELRKAVDGLGRLQSFNVIFFQDQATFVDRNLLPATTDSKRRTYTFLENVVPHGSTDPIPALKLAFEQKPDLIHLLTDGDFPDNQAVIRFIAAANSGLAKKVQVNTIAFLQEGEYAKVLKQIATENGGDFRHVTDRDLER